MNATLEVWLGSGLLQRHAADRQQVVEMLTLAERDLAQSHAAGISTDWQLTMSYNAALLAARAALAAAGYRVAGTGDRDRFQLAESLRYTAGVPDADVILLQRMMRKGHASDCQADHAVCDLEAGETYELGMRILGFVTAWLHDHHPDLIGY